MAVTPRICNISNKPIGPSDNKSIQITIADLDPQGRKIPNKVRIFDFSGKMRKAGQIDAAMVSFLLK